MAETEIDKDLTRLLKQARRRGKDEPLSYAVVGKGTSDGALLLSKKKLSPALIAAAVKETGGKLVSKGKCYGEEELLVFESVKEPPATLEKLIKKLAKRDTGLMIRPLARKGGVDDDDEDGPAEEDAPAEAPPVAEHKATGAVAYAKLLLAWEQAKKKSHAELQKLERTILAEFAGDPEEGAIRQEVRKLDDVLGEFDSSLADALDGAMNATDAAGRSRHHATAHQVITKYKNYVDTDPFIKDLQSNPFLPVTVQSTLSGTLRVLAKSLPV